MKRLWTCTLGALLLTTSALAAERALTYVDLVRRLTDLEQLAVLPEPGERCAQWSSWDRKSQWDAASGKYVGWDANGDGTGVIRIEGEQQVLAEMQGPGCIWRIWSARPQEGHVRIYLDGAAEPAVDLPFVGYFNHENEPFTGKALVHTVARGWNCYVPIPYQKSCRIVADKGWGRYYQFNYTTFPAGTKVPTFSRKLSAEESAALAAADKVLTTCELPSPQERAGGRPALATTRITFTVAPGGSHAVTRIDGPGAIASLRMKLEEPLAPRDYETMRELVLKITWDKDATPAVWCPLGDFFGTAPGMNRYRSLPLGVTEDGWWYCNWYMPFAEGAQISISNDGKQSRRIAFEVVAVPLTRPAESLGRFHAKWHRDAFLPPEPERRIDWTMLTTQGRGRFCGVMLHVWNPRGSWWGEGDEKFYVDGEKFPSTFGTGSEDYFGYAWCDPTLFQNAYHNQTISMGNKGHVSVNRWHFGDSIPFQTSFEGSIEKYFPNTRPTLYAAVAYWYLAPGGKDPYEPVPVDQRIGYWPEITALRVKGAIEGETLKVLKCTGGEAKEQNLANRSGNWSGESQVWWIKGKVGDRLDLALPVASAGKQQLLVQFTRARDYGIVQVWLDGKKVGAPIDLYNPDVSPSGEIDLGEHDLAAGQHTLTLEIVGANEKAVKAYMAGIDYVRLAQQP